MGFKCADCKTQANGTYYPVKRIKGKKHILKIFPTKTVCEQCYNKNYLKK